VKLAFYGASNSASGTNSDFFEADATKYSVKGNRYRKTARKDRKKFAAQSI
jgi:hypothetical protein